MLSDFLTAEVFGYLLIFVRMAAVLSLMPAIGESNIPAPVRIGLALTISIIVYPLVRDNLPALPSNSFAFVVLIVSEILIGLFIGLVARLMVSSLHVAGTVIAFQSGLAAAQSFDPAQAGQSAIFARFLALLGVVAIFASDLHHLALRAMAGSYVFFAPGEGLMVEDAMQVIVQVVAHSFALGMQIAAPFLVYGLVFNIALGLVARLMPQIQVFFIAMPANILLAFVILMFTLGAMMTWFLTSFESQLALYLF